MHLLPVALVVVAAALPASARWPRAGVAAYLILALALLPRAAERYGWAVQNMLTTARLMIAAATQRAESRGVHFRADFPESDPAWQRHIALSARDL